MEKWVTCEECEDEFDPCELPSPWDRLCASM